VDQFCPQVAAAMVTVLRRLKVEIYFPPEQTCCGQPAFNTGYWEEARALARRYCEVFADAEAIVSPSGSCVAMVRNFYPELLGAGVAAPVPGASHQAAGPSPRRSGFVRAGGMAATTPDWQRVCANTFEFSEFLVKKLGVTDVGARFPAKVTYHDGCHALRELRLKEEPRQLLRYVRDLELVEMDKAETCCGFGGTFSIKFPMISCAMDEVKITSIRRTGAEYVVSADSSCLMQIDGYARRCKLPIKTVSLAEVLAAT
jgi:L-lactate dehydrogenase complex protein LldE